MIISEIAFMAAELSTSARQVLIALMVRAERVSNPDLRRAYRIEIRKPVREELAAAGLINVERGRRTALFYELTDQGWARARREFRSPPPAGVAGAWLLLYGTLRHLAELLDRTDRKIADVFADPDPGPEAAGESVEDRILDAYRLLAANPGDLVRLAALRQHLTGVDRADQDRALTDLDRRREIHLDPDPARHELTPDAHDAAILIGGEAKHLITIGPA
jgi:DNA-binding PadR family transcriptional regulator